MLTKSQDSPYNTVQYAYFEVIKEIHYDYVLVKYFSQILSIRELEQQSIPFKLSVKPSCTATAHNDEVCPHLMDCEGVLA